jgi:hypothetical protein
MIEHDVMTRICLALTVAAVAATFGCTSAIGQSIESAYTPLDLDRCHHVTGKDVEDYGTWQCAGYRAIAVWVAAGDQRSYVSYGSNAKNEPAAKQTLAAFNTVGRMIEWRLERGRDGQPRPFATILRWSTTISDEHDTVRGQLLVVTRLGPGGVCHVGYVDARANRDSNALARQIADEHARPFRCASDKPVVSGERGPGFSIP